MISGDHSDPVVSAKLQAAMVNVSTKTNPLFQDPKSSMNWRLGFTGNLQ